MTAAEALAAARARLEEDAARVAKLEEEIAVDAEITEMGRNAMSVEEIDKVTPYGRERIKRVLTNAGLLSVRRRKLDPKETHEVIADLKSGLSVPVVAAKRNAAESLVRRLAKDNGVHAIRAPRKPKRTAEEIGRIRALDAAVKKEFGAGLSALGEVLRQANKDFVDLPAEPVPAPVEPPSAPTQPTTTSIGHDEIPTSWTNADVHVEQDDPFAVDPGQAEEEEAKRRAEEEALSEPAPWD